MKKLYILLAILFFITGCGRQTENTIKTSTETKNTQSHIVSDTVIPTTLASEERADKDLADQVNQLLPEGIVDASFLKRVYIYPSAEDEQREKELEKRFRDGINKNWDEILKNPSDIENSVLIEYYNKDVAMRDNYSPLLKFSIFLDLLEDEMSFEELIEFKELYYSAEEKIIEDYNTSLTINKLGKSKIEIICNDKPNLFKSIEIDFSNKSLKIGNDSFIEIGTKKDGGFGIIEYHFRRSSLEGKNINTEFLWNYMNKIDSQSNFAISKIEDTNQIVLRYAIFDFIKNQYKEDMILIKN